LKEKIGDHFYQTLLFRQWLHGGWKREMLAVCE